jgi:SAM-dependent methyltransferase
MPVVPNALERLVLVRLRLGPAALLDYLGALSMRVAIVAVRLGVIDALARGPATADRIASDLDLDPRGTRLLLDALEAVGYAKRRRDVYESSAMTARWAPLLHDGVDFFDRSAFDEWSHLEECVRDPSAFVDDKATWTEDTWRVFQGGMLAFARLTVGEVTAKLDVPSTAAHVLDLGGGHGLYAVALCDRHAQLRATIFDVPAAEPAARRTIAEAGLEARVAFRSGDFWVDDIGGDHDLVLLFNLLHGHDPERNRALLDKVVTSLAPGGRVAILDETPGRRFGPVGRAMGNLMALNMYMSASAQTYPVDVITDWMRTAGLTSIRHRRLVRTPGLTLCVGERP